MIAALNSALRPVHTEWKRKRKRQFSSMSVSYSWSFFIVLWHVRFRSLWTNLKTRGQYFPQFFIRIIFFSAENFKDFRTFFFCFYPNESKLTRVFPKLFLDEVLNMLPFFFKLTFFPLFLTITLFHELFVWIPVCLWKNATCPQNI